MRRKFLRAASLGLVSFLVQGALAAATPPPAIPQLRIETGFHSARPVALAVNEAAGIAASAGDDKVVRLWALPSTRQKTLESLGELRPPFAPGPLGKLFAVALDPAASPRWIATGGDGGSPGSHALYVFDLNSGQMVRALADFAGPIKSMAASPDGRLLAIGMEGANGVVVMRTSDWTQAKKFSAPDSVYGLAFSQDGRLVMTTVDGLIRLYDARFAQIAEIRAREGAVPFGAAFRPSGDMVAVGYEGMSAIELRDGKTLALNRVLSPRTKSKDKPGLTRPAWSRDGNAVYGAGAFVVDGNEFPIFRWELGATLGTPPKELMGAEIANTIMAVHALGADGILALSQKPSLVAFDSAGKGSVLVRGPSHDMRPAIGPEAAADLAAFRTGAAGTIVEVPGSEGPGRTDRSRTFQKSILFDVGKRNFVRRREELPAMSSPLPRDAKTDAQIDCANLRTILKHGSKRVDLGLADCSHLNAHAFLPNAASVALTVRDGARFALRRTGLDGKDKFPPSPLPAEGFRVTVSDDGLLIIAALGDGTVRWFDAASGQELLALFVTEPDRRWIAWTPSGLYDASPGAEELIGWHVNRGADRAAMYFSAARFRETYYSPGIGRKVLLSRKPMAPPKAKIDAVLGDLPPMVRIVGVTQTGNGQAEVSFVAETANGQPLTDAHVLIDGQLLSRGLSRALPGADGVRRVRVDVPASPDARTISVAVTSATGKQSDPAERRGIMLQATPKGGPGSGNLYALIVGVSAYKDATIPQLNFADDDARAIETVLKLQKGVLYSDVIVKKPLVDKTATRADILEGLDWLTATPKDGDVSILFMAGHGLKRPVNASDNSIEEYYFAPHDLDWSGRKIVSTGVSFTAIQQYVSRVRGKKLVFLDTCHSGQMGEQDPNGLVNSIGGGTGAVIWASSTGNQLSFERPEWKNGAFTLALLEAFKGRLPEALRNNNGRFTQRQLSTWLDKRVAELTDDKQTPSTFDISGAAFEVGAVTK